MKIISKAILTVTGLSVLAVGWRAGEAPLALIDVQAIAAPNSTTSPTPSATQSPSASASASPSATPKSSSSGSSASTTKAAPKPTKTAAAPAPAKPSGTFTGPTINSQYGAIQMQLVVKNGKITGINTLQNGRSDSETQSINARAIPKLVSEVLSAQTYKVSYVSGASYTSPGVLGSIKGAMGDAGL